MQVFFAPNPLKYDGSQLSSHFALRNFDVRGDSIVVFTGPMDIEPSKIADLEDWLNNDEIRSPRMLHFIVERFQASLESMVLLQRLLVRLAADLLASRGVKSIRVQGDDLYVGEGKLSVSIAAPSPVSCLIHFGMNIDIEGVPVKAAGLRALGVEAEPFGKELARAWVNELESIQWAVTKVRGVK